MKNMPHATEYRRYNSAPKRKHHRKKKPHTVQVHTHSSDHLAEGLAALFVIVIGGFLVFRYFAYFIIFGGIIGLVFLIYKFFK